MNRTTVTIELWVISAVLFGSCCAAEGSEAPAAMLSAEELRQRIGESMKRIWSFCVVYESRDYDSTKFPSGTYLHRIVVAKSPHSLYHVSGHGHDTLDWRDDFYLQRAYVTKDHLSNEFSVNRHYFDHELKPTDALPGSLPQEFFFIATGIWPLTARQPPRPDGRPYMLTQVAVSSEFSLVRPHLELINGRWCHVLEWPNYDTLWIDVTRGCSLLARETNSRDNGALVQRIELSNHREVGPEIWFPTKLRNIQYDWRSPVKSQRKRVVIDAMHEVQEMSVNDISNDIFRFSQRPGMLLDNGIDTPKQAVPGGLRHLDSIVSWLERNSRSVEKLDSQITDSVFWLFGPSLVLVIILEVVRFVLSRLRHNRARIEGVSCVC